MEVLEGHRPKAALQLLEKIHGEVPPRVSAAVLSTMLNRWITEEQMPNQRKIEGTRCSGCILGCEDGKDSIAHYSVCLHVSELLKGSSTIKRGPTNRAILIGPLFIGAALIGLC